MFSLRLSIGFSNLCVGPQLQRKKTTLPSTSKLLMIHAQGMSDLMYHGSHIENAVAPACRANRAEHLFARAVWRK